MEYSLAPWINFSILKYQNPSHNVIVCQGEEDLGQGEVELGQLIKIVLEEIVCNFSKTNLPVHFKETFCSLWNMLLHFKAFFLWRSCSLWRLKLLHKPIVIFLFWWKPWLPWVYYSGLKWPLNCKWSHCYMDHLYRGISFWSKS